MWLCPEGGFFGGMGKSFGDITVVKEHHECVFHAPSFHGDELYPVLTQQDFRDATPEGGSTWHTWALRVRERRHGGEPLCREDVALGDQPPVTADGPIRAPAGAA